MKPANPRILTINGGSSSIKFALFEAGDSMRRILEGGLERIGLPEASFRVKGTDQADNFARPVSASNHTLAVGILMDWIEQRIGHTALSAVGHRVLARRSEVLQAAANHSGNSCRVASAQSIRS
jgi:acetate kinase